MHEYKDEGKGYKGKKKYITAAKNNYRKNEFFFYL